MSGFYTLNEFSAHLKKTRQTTSSYLNDGVYYGVKRGNSYKIPKSSAEMAELITELKELGGEPLILSNTQHKGGVGKTAMTLNLATAYAIYGLRCLIVDMDSQGNSSSILDCDISPNYNFMEKNITKLLFKVEDILDDAELDDEIEETIVHLEHPLLNGTLDLLPNHFEMGSDAELFSVKAGSENYLNRILKRIKHNYDVIIIDNSPSIGTIWRMSTMASNSLIIPLKPDKYTLQGFSGLFLNLRRMKSAYRDRHDRELRVLGASLVNVNLRTNNDMQTYDIMNEVLKERGLHVFEQKIKSSTQANEAQYYSGSVLLYEPTSTISGEYFQLAYEVYKEHSLYAKGEK